MARFGSVRLVTMGVVLAFAGVACGSDDGADDVAVDESVASTTEAPGAGGDVLVDGEDGLVDGGFDESSIPAEWLPYVDIVVDGAPDFYGGYDGEGRCVGAAWVKAIGPEKVLAYPTPTDYFVAEFDVATPEVAMAVIETLEAECGQTIKEAQQAMREFEEPNFPPEVQALGDACLDDLSEQAYRDSYFEALTDMPLPEDSPVQECVDLVVAEMQRRDG